MSSAARTANVRRLACLSAVVFASLAVSPAAKACQACFGAEDSPLIDGARSGAFALLLVVAGVQVGFVAFFIHLRKRARIVAAMEASSPWADHTPSTR